jgi:hypothetical protein
MKIKGGDCHFFKWKLCELKKYVMLYEHLFILLGSMRLFIKV